MTDTSYTEQPLTGRGWAFPVQFYRPGQGPAMVDADEEIRQALAILIGTARGERAMRPDWGSPLPDFMFTTIDSDSLARLEEQIAETVQVGEPRISLSRVALDSSAASDGLLLISLDYLIRDTNRRDNLVYPFYLQETEA